MNLFHVNPDSTNILSWLETGLEFVSELIWTGPNDLKTALLHAVRNKQEINSNGYDIEEKLRYSLDWNILQVKFQIVWCSKMNAS